MATKLHALDYLADNSAADAPAVCVAAGDETFLKREVLTRLQKTVLDDDDGEFSLTVLVGRDAEFCDVVDAISTVAMFGSSRRLVQIDQADDFVTKYRPELESYVERPASAGVLVLDVKTWPGNTRLAKAVAKTGLVVECKMPTSGKGGQIDALRVGQWLRERAKQHHGAKLEPAACEALLAMVEPNFGLLDQELAKLCPMVKPGESVTVDLVERAVGNWRTRKTWDMIDAMLAGNARDALHQLDRLILSGEEPIALLAQLGASLRRLAAATACIRDAERSGRRISLSQALQQAGVQHYFVKKSEQQLRQLGRPRANRLFGWLLEADLAMKGASSSPPRKRLVLERLIVQLSSAAKEPNPRTAVVS
jgi:DNA polymerase-3 subunit delta